MLHYGVGEERQRGVRPIGSLDCIQAWSQSALQTLATVGVGKMAVGAAILINSSTIGLTLGIAGATVAMGGAAILIIGGLFAAIALAGTIENLGAQAGGNLYP